MVSIICALVLAAVGLRFLPTGASIRAKVMLVLVVMVASLLPFPWGLSGWVLSLTSDFSVTSGLLALVAIQHRMGGRPLLPVRELRFACILIVLLAMMYYPMSLGATYFDPYALGYGDFRFSTALLLLGLFAWISRAYASCLLLICAQLAYWFDALSSNNLWDYLLDPFLCFWTIGWLLRERISRLRVSSPA